MRELTVKELSEIANVSTTTIYSHISKYGIKVKEVNNIKVLFGTELQEYLKEHTNFFDRTPANEIEELKEIIASQNITIARLESEAKQVDYLKERIKELEADKRELETKKDKLEDKIGSMTQEAVNEAKEFKKFAFEFMEHYKQSLPTKDNITSTPGPDETIVEVEEIKPKDRLNEQYKKLVKKFMAKGFVKEDAKIRAKKKMKKLGLI